jgi:hypothetical protein
LAGFDYLHYVQQIMHISLMQIVEAIIGIN